jgi:N-acetylglutamate synthase-like GNAT family acetyltransferase
LSKEIYVRTAEPDDEDGIINLAKVVNIENGLFEMNEEKVRNIIRPFLYLHKGIIGVIGSKNNLEGGIILKVSQNWYSDAYFLEEMCVFVHPDYRVAKGGRARKLVEFAKKASEKLNMPLLIGVLSNSRTDAKTRLYERQFGTPAGAFFLYGMKTGIPPSQEAAS